jgi:hypothetical protein
MGGGRGEIRKNPTIKKPYIVGISCVFALTLGECRRYAVTPLTSALAVPPSPLPRGKLLGN